MNDHSNDLNSFRGIGKAFMRLFNRRAKETVNKAAEAVHKGTDFVEAYTVNAEHPSYRKSEVKDVPKVFGTAAGLVGIGAALVWATHGIPATIGYGLMTLGKGTFFRGCRVLKPYEPHNPAKWAPGSRVLAIADFLEASSRNLPHPWMKPASPNGAKTRLIVGVSAMAIGFAMGITTVGVGSMIGTALYAGGGFVAYRAYRTMRPFDPTPKAPAAPSLVA